MSFLRLPQTSIMPAYALVPTPAGDCENVYDLQAIRMAALHNVLIRSFNSITAHAPNIEPTEVSTFMNYCQSVVSLALCSHLDVVSSALDFFNRQQWCANITQQSKTLYSHSCKQHLSYAQSTSIKSSLFSEAKLGKLSSKTHDFMLKLNEWAQLCKSIQLGNAHFDSTTFVVSLRQSTDLHVKDLVDEIAILEVCRSLLFSTNYN